MLEVVIPEQHYEFFDDEKQEFLPEVHIKETKLQLEHSLISLKKWEQKWHKPFLKDKDKNHIEMSDYVRCMTLNHGVDPNVYNYIPQEVMAEVEKYISDPMTATWFKDDGKIGAQKSSREIVTAEIIYYWMISLNIPVEFQKWHLNQLTTLIRVVNIKNQGDKKGQKFDRMTAAKERAALNAKRRAALNSSG